ncbi:MAG TPA: asparagine synthase-related protein [Candidatus Kapabacteria bacterium]
MIFGKFSFKGVGAGQIPPSANVRAFTDGCLSLSAIYPEKLSYANSILVVNERYTLHVFGELILPSGILLHTEVHAREFIEGIIRNESEYLAKCRGVFCLVLYDNIRKTLKLTTDGFGNLALHYHYTEGTLCFSTDLGKLTSMVESVTLNNDAILEYLGFGQPLGEKTLFTRVQRLDRATILEYDEEGINIRSYHRFSYPTAGNKDIPAILSALEEEMLSSADSIPNNPSTEVSLSGGFDSRITAAALIKLGKKDITFYTHGREDSHDILIASLIADRFGYRHRKLLFDTSFFASLHENFESTVGNSFGAFDIRSSPVMASWKTLPSEVICSVDSHGGPLLRRQILKAKAFTSKKYPNIADFVLAYIHSPLLTSGCLNHDVAQEAKQRSLFSLEEIFGKLPSDHGNAIDTFYLDQMCAHRYSVAANLQMDHVILSHPLLTARIADLIFMIPSELRAKNIIPRHLISSFAPELTKIPLDNAGFHVPYKGYRWRRYFPHAAERLFNSKLRKPIFFPSDIINANIGALEEIILSSTNDHLNSARIEAVLTEHKSGKDRSELLIAIVSASILFQRLKEIPNTSRKPNH